MRRGTWWRWLRWIFGVAALLAGAFVAYAMSLVPKPPGQPAVLQTSLFAAPPTPFPMEGRYVYRSAGELAAMIRRRETTSVAVVTEHLNHIKNNNHRYAAFVYLREKEALAEAKAADAAVERGEVKPLLGVPVSIKEMIWVKGSPSTRNAKVFSLTAPRDAAIVTQLKIAGAIVLGTTNVPYMVADYQTQGELYPPASNPFDVSRTPGGSSGGGAAALAAGFTALELGTDTGGSLRVPAVFCGLWTLKPTFGALNYTEGAVPDPNFPMTRFALTSPGPMARTPEDLALAWEVLQDSPRDERYQTTITWAPATSKTLADYRFAWIDQWQDGTQKVRVSEETALKLADFVATLRRAGAETERGAPDLYRAMAKLFFSSFASITGQGRPWLARKLIQFSMHKMNSSDGDFTSAFDQSLMDNSDADWRRSEQERGRLAAEWDKFFKGHDFFIVPVTYGGAFAKGKTGAPIAADDGRTVEYLSYVPYSYVFNAVGLPAITVPIGRNRQGLPLGIQIVGPQYSDPELLHLAQLLRPVSSEFVPPTHVP